MNTVLIAPTLSSFSSFPYHTHKHATTPTNTHTSTLFSFSRRQRPILLVSTCTATHPQARQTRQGRFSERHQAPSRDVHDRDDISCVAETRMTTARPAGERTRTDASCPAKREGGSKSQASYVRRDDEPSSRAVGEVCLDGLCSSIRNTNDTARSNRCCCRDQRCIESSERIAPR